MKCCNCHKSYKTDKKFSHCCDECRSRAKERYKKRYIPPRLEMKAIHPSAQGDYGQGPIYKLYDNKKGKFVNISEIARVI